MQKLSRTKLLPVFLLLLILVFLAKFIGVIAYWFLPSEGVELNAEKSYQAKYQRVDFKNMLINAKVEKQALKTVSTTQKTSHSINSLVLKGLYGKGNHGFAIVAKKTSPKKTTIVSVGEQYGGYLLKEIKLTQVIFSKSGKNYVLMLQETLSKNSALVKKRQKVSQKSSAQSDEKSVSKKDIEHYSKDPSKIWKDIAIAPLKKNGKIIGFKVNRIKKGSKMDTLGLKKGDVIIKANNIALTSFNDALNLYKKIDTIETIALVVLRNNQEKEIIYEIH